ncbi:hypothetical protein [uncultured Methanobrevibacter sp.]|uniref:hypothetical protein n=1 Tax=uncultured Methanobrevibacter sp. TaxID=253161 RepID=UPI0025EDA1D0|nr:hypothetical protein [uncultured Methanobrevibacter sp.]
METAALLLQILIPNRVLFARMKLEQSEYLKKLWNYQLKEEKSLFEDEDFLLDMLVSNPNFPKNFISNYKEYLGELVHYVDKLELLDIMVDNHITSAKEDLNRLENTASCIHLQDNNYNIRLDGKRIELDTCHGCGEKIFRIKADEPCPKCSSPIRMVRSMFVD